MTPYLAALARRRRQHHRIRRRGGRSSNNNNNIISVRPERPSSIVRPQPDSLISTAQPSTSPSCGQQPRPSRARAGNGSEKVNAERLLKASMNALSVGFPGLEKSSVTPR